MTSFGRQLTLFKTFNFKTIYILHVLQTKVILPILISKKSITVTILFVTITIYHSNDNNHLFLHYGQGERSGYDATCS